MTVNHTYNNTSALTNREVAVGRMMLDGHKTVEIADHLALGRSIVAATRKQLWRKLGVRTRKELRQFRDLFQE